MRKLTKKELIKIYAGGFFEDLGYVLGYGTKKHNLKCSDPKYMFTRFCNLP